MTSMLIQVLILQLLIHVVNTIGASTINNLLWTIYNRLSTPSSKSAGEQRRLQTQILELRRELNATSSQDEFAKWAKLRRRHDKVIEQLEKKKASADSSRATFDRTASTLRWIFTNGLRMFMQFWYSKQPMFWVPHGWFPFYAEWILSFPRAPIGSISIQAWWLACTSVILLVSDASIALTGLFMESIAFPARPGKGSSLSFAAEKLTRDTKDESKKEL